ncbi:hypothetical protein [Natronorubrum halophilum]|uniref:hypothetical protein n=1 Tax=Natronorubrum halophilum TaxID=1702106 RepID=UPI0014853FC7|nr:hypothetical protein [Natronorubrum halophilum]
MQQRQSAKWMQQLDDRILEHLDDEPWSSPAVISSRTEFRASKDRIRERCQMLSFAGLIAPIHCNMYEITKWGELYLSGEIDAGHQPTPPQKVVPRS